MRVAKPRSELGNRLLVAVIGVPTLVAVITLGGVLLTFVVALVLLIASYEMVTTRGEMILPTATLIFVGVALLPIAALLGLPFLIVGTCIALVILTGTYLAGSLAFDTYPWNFLIILYLGFLGGHFVLLRSLSQGAEWCFLILVATILTDTGAYFFGKLFGRTPFFPSISPNKTLEGTFGGVMLGVAGVFFATTILGSVADFDLEMKDIIIIGLVVATAAVLGDLFESKLKRSVGVKDFGNLLPGHGGVVDRIDSWLFTVPTGYYYLQVLVF